MKLTLLHELYLQTIQQTITSDESLIKVEKIRVQKSNKILINKDFKI